MGADERGLHDGAGIGVHPRSSAVRPPATSEIYLAALRHTRSRPVTGEQGAALHAFLTLNAAYFLGEWMPPRRHRALVRRLASALDGLEDLAVPDDPAHAAQVAQHVRELAAAFGPDPWTEAIVRRTAHLVPCEPNDWDAQVMDAAQRADDHALLVAHAQRRLWELEHPAGSAARVAGSVTPPRRIALQDGGDGHAIQVVEATLAEIDANPALAADLLPTVTLR